MQYRYTDDGKKRHAHELDKGDGFRPLIGTTTALNEVFPPPLAWWGSAMALERLGWITEKKEPDVEKRLKLLAEGQESVRLAADMNLEDYRDWLEGCYRNHDEYKKSKGKAGTDVHALIEGYIKRCIRENEGKPMESHPEIMSFVKWSSADVERFLWSEAHCFSEKLWLGGITDFGFVHKNGMLIIGDNKPSIYPKSFIQTALYGIQIRENGLVDAAGEKDLNATRMMATLESKPGLSGYCIFDYNGGEVRYRTDVDRLENIGRTAIDLYKNKDVTGTPTP